jgi:hypothetical protein
MQRERASSRKYCFELGHEESRKLVDLLDRYILAAPAAGLICLFLIRALRRSIDAAAWSRMTRTTTFGAGRANSTSKFPQSPFRQQHRINDGILMEKRQHTRIVGKNPVHPRHSWGGTMPLRGYWILSLVSSWHNGHIYTLPRSETRPWLIYCVDVG